MPWFLYHAFKQLFPTGRWFPFFTFMSGLGVAVGVALMLVTSSIMGGFGYEIRRMIVDTEGEIQITARQGIVDEPNAVAARVREVPGVAGATATARGQVMITHGNRQQFPVLRGVDLATTHEVFDLQRFMLEGSLDQLDDDSVLLSAQLAIALQTRVGMEVELTSPQSLLRFSRDGEIYLPQIVRVAGIFQIGHPQLDGSLAICTLRRMQDVYGLESGVHLINVRLQPGVSEFGVVGAIDAELPASLRAITWVEAWGDFTRIIQFEKYMVVFLLAFIVVVAAISIMSSLLISVVRKTREIGLLNALGARTRDVAASFCVQGLFLGTLGTGAGLALGLLVLHYRMALMKLVANLVASEDAFHVIYGFVNLPRRTEPRDLVLIIVGAILCSGLAGVIPAWRAARLKPVEALRSE